MQENLIGYLLGALDGDEQADIQQRLEYDPELREQLREIEAKLIPLEQERWQHEPPAGLAAATCKFVFEQKATPASVANKANKPLKQRAGFSQLSEWNPRKHGWDVVDAVIAAGIFIAAALLFFPAIANSRHLARMTTCQDNLRQVGFSMGMFGEQNNGVLPYIPNFGNTGVAGYYAPQLVESGLLQEQGRFLCPSSELACLERGSFRVPSTAQINSASGERLVNLQKKMGGSYMYTLGHFDGGKHNATVNRGRKFFPVLADAHSTVSGKAANPHGREGHNVAFEDGHVRFVIGMTPNHPFLVSERGLVEAGSHELDPVLGLSSTRPQARLDNGTPAEVGIAPRRLRIQLRIWRKAAPASTTLDGDLDAPINLMD